MKKTFTAIILLAGFAMPHLAQAGYHVRRSFSSYGHGHRSVRCAPVVHHVPSGHYEYRKQQVWQEGHYDIERDDCGRSIRIWHPGYYKTVTHKVWVSHSRRHGGHSGHGRH